MPYVWEDNPQWFAHMGVGIYFIYKNDDCNAGIRSYSYGTDSWELDALDPEVLSELISTAVLALRDEDLWDDALRKETFHRQCLAKAAANWSEVVEHLERYDDPED